MELVTCVAVITSCVTTLVHAYIAYKKSKEPPKDPIWEAALAIVTSANSGLCDADEFARVYQQLQAFKANGYSFAGKNSLAQLVKEAPAS